MKFFGITGKQIKTLFEKEKPKRPWSLKPESPEECPACVEEVVSDLFASQ
jgi:hypothetical protein